jgi:hypothetical protein
MMDVIAWAIGIYLFVGAMIGLFLLLTDYRGVVNVPRRLRWWQVSRWMVAVEFLIYVAIGWLYILVSE